MVREFNDSDEGKKVVTADGDVVGMVEQVQGTRAHVKPDANLSSSMRRRLGWTKEGSDTYELKHSAVKSIEDDEITIRRSP